MRTGDYDFSYTWYHPLKCKVSPGKHDFRAPLLYHILAKSVDLLGVYDAFSAMGRHYVNDNCIITD